MKNESTRSWTPRRCVGYNRRKKWTGVPRALKMSPYQITITRITQRYTRARQSICPIVHMRGNIHTYMIVRVADECTMCPSRCIAISCHILPIMIAHKLGTPSIPEYIAWADSGCREGFIREDVLPSPDFQSPQTQSRSVYVL